MKYSKKQLKALRIAGIALLRNAGPIETRQALLKLVSTFDIPAKKYMSLADVRQAMHEREMRDIFES